MRIKNPLPGTNMEWRYLSGDNPPDEFIHRLWSFPSVKLAVGLSKNLHFVGLKVVLIHSAFYLVCYGSFNGEYSFEAKPTKEDRLKLSEFKYINQLIYERK